MVKDDKFICSDFPQYKIKYGMLNQEDEKKIKEWLDDNVRNLCVNININIKDTEKCKDFVKSFVNEVYEQIHQVGYDEGYDSAIFETEEQL